MPDVAPLRRHGRPLPSALVVLLVGALLGLVPVTASAMPVEGYPSYEPQRRCDPAPKRGTLMLADHLVQRYRGSGSSGISRSCGASGRSEHKEGRAFDWRLDARSARDRGYARHFLERLFRTDRAGNRNALARRMGIMYVIWDDAIYASYHGYRKRAYKHAACRRVSSCSATLRHRDHMHISLSWAGARARTSWYRARLGQDTPPPVETAPEAPRPAPEPTTPPREAAPPPGVVDLRDRPYRTLRVPVTGRTMTTRWKLQEGVTYSLTAAGLYTFGGPRKVSDAVCVWARSARTWRPGERTRTERRHRRHGLVVNGRQPFGTTCAARHRYRTTITPSSDQPLRLRVAGHSARTETRGHLTVVLGRKKARVGEALPTYPDLTPAPATRAARHGRGLLTDTVTLPADAGTRWTTGSLDPSATYRVTVRGTVDLGDGVRSDGRCVQLAGEWYRSAPIDPRVPDQDHGQLYLAGVPFAGTSTGGCGAGPHVAELTPDRAGRLQLDLWDPLDRDDNSGSLSVTVQRLSPLVAPTRSHRARPRSGKRWHQRTDEVAVAVDDPAGTVTTMRLRKGERVTLRTQGSYRSGGVRADAACVRGRSGWGPTATDLAGEVATQDPYAVWVDGVPVRWRPVGGGTCSTGHEYATGFTATKNGPLRLAVLDVDHRDNAGRLTVTVRRRR